MGQQRTREQLISYAPGGDQEDSDDRQAVASYTICSFPAKSIVFNGNNRITYFLILCEELHFTRAAKRCGIAQPSLTNAIRALEEELGGSLFRRKPKPHLTELGTAVQPHLREALRQIELAFSKAQTHGRQDKRRVRRKRAQAR